MKQRVYWN